MLEYIHMETVSALEGVVIHPRALVYKGAKIGQGSIIGPNAVIGPKVVLHERVKVDFGAIVSGRTTIGTDTEVSAYATIGSPPQDLKYKGEDTELVIGKNNKLREYVNISLGTPTGGGITTIGDNNLIMAYCHVGHDCVIGSRIVLANSVHLAGHVTLQDFSILGGTAAVHQFTRIGERVMVAGGAIVVQDVPPFCLVQGDRARISGLNVVGLRRSDLPKDRISDIKSMFKILYNENLTMQDAIVRIESEVPSSEQRTRFIDFLKQSERGICR